MKKLTLTVFLGIALLGLASVALADSAAKVRADVPFAFYADKELIPAGSYIFEFSSFGSGPTASTVLVRTPDGNVVTILLTKAGNDIPADMAHLHFNKYGKRHFLSKVEGAGYQANLTATKVEREMRAQAESARETAIIGAN